MSPIAFFLIVASAALHATWNLMAKKSHMTVAFYAVICSTAMLSWLHVQFWTPIKVTALSLRFFLLTCGSAFCDALLYSYGLKKTYEAMEMATAYPIMRATPILLTAFFTAMLGLGTPVGWLARLGFVVVFIGALMMPLNSWADFQPSRYLTWGMVYVLIAACGTTGYTIFDSEAQAALRQCVPEIAKPITSITYYNIRGIVLTTTLWVLVLFNAKERASALGFWRERNWRPILAGICASLTYVLVLLAMNYVTNVSYVQVFRQLGLPLGMLGGMVVLKEKAPLIKWAGVALIVVGLTLTVLS